jgi:hypothetical protein
VVNPSKAQFRHALRSRNHVSSTGVFIRSFTLHLLFLLARQYTPISNDFIRSRYRVIISNGNDHATSFSCHFGFLRSSIHGFWILVSLMWILHKCHTGLQCNQFATTIRTSTRLTGRGKQQQKTQCRSIISPVESTSTPSIVSEH